METKLIIYFNIKGGIYKTSMSIITAYELAKDKNKKILLWDLDLQENLTQYVYKVNHEDKLECIVNFTILRSIKYL